MTVRDIFYLLAHAARPPARQREREEDQMRGSPLGAVGGAGLARTDADGRAMIVSRDVQDAADGPNDRSRIQRALLKYEERKRGRERGGKEQLCSAVRPTINKVPSEGGRDRVTPPFVMKLYGAVGGTNERTIQQPAKAKVT